MDIETLPVNCTDYQAYVSGCAGLSRRPEPEAIWSAYATAYINLRASYDATVWPFFVNKGEPVPETIWALHKTLMASIEDAEAFLGI